MEIESSRNYRVISELLTTSGEIGFNEIKSLSQMKYDIVINLLPDGHEDMLPNESELIESYGLKYIHIPVDFENPELGQYKKFSQAIESYKEKKVHIHCGCNWRVSAFYAAYSVSNGIWSQQQARDFVNSIWEPVNYPKWRSLLARFGV